MTDPNFDDKGGEEKEGDNNVSQPLNVNNNGGRKGRVKKNLRPPQDSGYSWVVLAACFMLALHYSCLLSHFGIFLVEYMEYFDVKKSSLVWIGSLLTSLGFIFGNVSSMLIKKYGFRKFGFASGLGACISFIVTASASNIAMLYLGSGLSFINMFLMSMMAVQCYFDKKRALASGIHTAGLSAGVFIWPFVSRYLIDQYGWRGAMAILGALQLHTLIYVALIRPVSFDQLANSKESLPAANNKNNKNDISKIDATSEERTQLADNKVQETGAVENGSHAPNGSHLKSPESRRTCGTNAKSTCTKLMYNTVYPLKEFYPIYPVALLGFVLMQCGFINFYMMCPVLARDNNISKYLGGILLSIFGAVNGFLRVGIGFVADKVDSSLMLASWAIIGGILSVLALIYTEFYHLVIYASLYAISSATYMVLVTPVIRDIVDIEHLPAAVGTTAFFIGIDHLVTLFIAGILYDWTDFVAYNFVVYGIVQILSGGVFLLLYFMQKKTKKSSMELEVKEVQDLVRENGEAKA